MSQALRRVIEEARGERVYCCARCDYELGRVPLGDDLSVVCPECGYEMVFSVRVQLRPRDPAYDREVRSRLSRIEMTLVIIGICVIASIIGLGIIVYALTA